MPPVLFTTPLLKNTKYIYHNVFEGITDTLEDVRPDLTKNSAGLNKIK